MSHDMDECKIQILRYMIQGLWHWLTKWLDFKSAWRKSWPNSWWKKHYQKTKSNPNEETKLKVTIIAASSKTYFKDVKEKIRSNELQAASAKQRSTAVATSFTDSKEIVLFHKLQAASTKNDSISNKKRHIQ